ncbi:nucleoside monophosphate kinase [Candidatus Woesebacteria bacterium]|nr:nucleoside monophosphate kinase [Candidatus Woesebacteria bacterium]MCD8507625.1 nucleoside monophosphate kinase [Candidatus Woesebacteria bacterium]MCD8526789.1 nucleoside monophosphate kinase [Candidatus Woesebacteria bacterium]MCD8546465.1 nucleoside monophosphate kinase [Candidatus Woesebacteria bacterium]
MKVVLMGIQGAGKSTQGNLLAEKYGISYLSSGHIFRTMAQEKTPMGRYIKETMSSGALIPDERTLEIVEGYLDRPEYEAGYILDGFPRTPAQAEAFKNGLDAVLFLDISDKEALWRIAGRIMQGTEIRDDETLPAIRKRIDLFHEYTEPVIEYYRQKGLLEHIDGERDVQEIFNDICKRIEARLAEKQ